ncbi:hypothetical protein [Botrimarina mediterranea]|uniref:Uncharacterized protein n=1 Tax=Botrimarina mediterranea TaxID=2528022 RepID=A0A518K9R7_9BACT|nr:hypothetical protein [Botrimarina mediterranea]QDV74534.1 hypothetical protein Spa11_27380 [Botrimarina mediterranea]QDV79174.1 hypothetical protein K2D_27850 [Planctomycetes bacterium K2D]
MTLQIDIPEEIAQKLAERVALTGANPVDYVIHAVQQSLAEAERLDRAVGPVREAYAASGLSEDGLGDLLEAEKHALRRGE